VIVLVSQQRITASILVHVGSSVKASSERTWSAREYVEVGDECRVVGGTVDHVERSLGRGRRR
jgi:hypothetical protein